jgi:hypothetical protein
MELKTMTKDERSLLLFFETCAVDRGGLVDTRHMNGDDMATAKRWHEASFLKFGRVKFHDIKHSGRRVYSHWCELSDDAWRLAHEERRARFARLSERRDWVRTEELRMPADDQA